MRDEITIFFCLKKTNGGNHIHMRDFIAVEVKMKMFAFVKTGEI